MINRWNPFNR